MTGTCTAPTTICTASRARCRASTPDGRATRSSRCADIAWLEFEKPDLDRAEAFAHAFGFTHRRCAPPTSCSCAAPTPERRACSLRRGAAVAVRRRRVPGRGRRRRAAAGRRDRRDRTNAAGEPRRDRGRPGRPERDAGPRGRGHARAARAARPAAADASTSGTDVDAGQRDPAAAAGAGEGAAARPRRAADHQVPRGARTGTSTPRPDRQRLPLLPGPARARAGDELHPLRPRLHPDRPPHPGDGARARQPLRALGLPGRRPRRAGRRRGVPARARLPPVLGHRPAHPGQPDLRLLARPGRLPGRALQPTATCSTAPSSRAGRR